MCGIYGQLRFDGQSVAPKSLSVMGRAMVHRGPDDEGLYSVGPIGLGMRRLSIIDLAGGQQPFQNPDRSVVLVANGEIYNFQELRLDLERRGCQFRSHSDCETILWGYLEWGLEQLLKKLNGMYAFALWDAKVRRLIIVRDRLGIKPLYYHFDDRAFSFASEIKSLLALGVPAEFNQEALPAYLSLGYVPAPQTLFRGIQKLPVATCAAVAHGTQVKFERYWSLPTEVQSVYSDSEWRERVRGQLETSVARQMVSDVPLGAFLSGGIDSSAVVAFMAKHASGALKTYAIGFEGDGANRYYNELPYAQQVAQLFKTEHREILVKPDVATLLPQLLWQMDEPIADSAFLTTFLVSEFARREVTVILSGVGGDELFGGYRRYLGEHFAARYQRLPSFLRALMHRLADRLPADRHNRWLDLGRLARAFILTADLGFEQRYRSYIEVFVPETIGALCGVTPRNDDAVSAAFESSEGQDLLNRLLNVDSRTQLPDDLLLLTDKMSMAVSLECRVPLLDHELVELAAAIPASVKLRRGNLKHILKEALQGILPKEILYRKKRGFGAPMGAWLRKELLGLMNQVLSESSLKRRGIFDPRVVQQVVDEHMSRKADHTDHLQALINFELWCRLYLDGHSVGQVQDGLVRAAA